MHVVIACGLFILLCYRGRVMADENKEDAKLVSAYAQTRKSLIAKLENWEDQRRGTIFTKRIGS